MSLWIEGQKIKKFSERDLSLYHCLKLHYSLCSFSSLPGGYNSMVKEFPMEYNQGFMGCIQHLIVDTEEMSIRDLALPQRGEMKPCSVPFEFWKFKFGNFEFEIFVWKIFIFKTWRPKNFFSFEIPWKLTWSSGNNDSLICIFIFLPHWHCELCY